MPIANAGCFLYRSIKNLKILVDISESDARDCHFSSQYYDPDFAACIFLEDAAGFAMVAKSARKPTPPSGRGNPEWLVAKVVLAPPESGGGSE